MKTQINFASLLNLAQYYLAKRDHSSQELTNKLIKYCLIKNTPKTTQFKAKNTKNLQEEPKRANRDVDTEALENTDRDIDIDFNFSSQNHHISPQQQTVIEEVIFYCKTHKWIDDERFTQSYIMSQHKKGAGKNKLRQNLYQKGITKELITLSLENADIDWFELAKETALKKFKSITPNASQEEKAKIARFLQARGFSFDEINTLFD